MTKLKDYIKAERISQGLSMRELAERSGIVISSVSRIESGSQKNEKNIEAVLSALGKTWKDAESAGVDFSIQEEKKTEFQQLIEWAENSTQRDIKRVLTYAKALKIMDELEKNDE